MYKSVPQNMCGTRCVYLFVCECVCVCYKDPKRAPVSASQSSTLPSNDQLSKTAVVPVSVLGIKLMFVELL